MSSRRYAPLRGRTPESERIRLMVALRRAELEQDDAEAQRLIELDSDLFAVSEAGTWWRDD